MSQREVGTIADRSLKTTVPYSVGDYMLDIAALAPWQRRTRNRPFRHG